MIAVVDYGMGNLRSVAKALAQVAPTERVIVSSDAAEIRSASRVVLPGQSAMPETMAGLERSNLREVVLQAIDERPFLGICLGLQMLFESSEEGPTACLGILPGTVRRFREAELVTQANERLKIPHMGWNRVLQTAPHPLWNAIPDGSRFYFAHSFYPVPADSALTAGTAAYPAPFTCAIARANIFAVQFHPEKSQRAGLQLLANFVTWDPRS